MLSCATTPPKLIVSSSFSNAVIAVVEVPLKSLHGVDPRRAWVLAAVTSTLLTVVVRLLQASLSSIGEQAKSAAIVGAVRLSSCVLTPWFYEVTRCDEV